MIVDSGNSGDRGDEPIDESGDIALRHTWAQFMRLGVALADGFHREMEHYFVSAAMGFFGDVDGVRIVGQHGNRERIGEREDGFGGGVVLAEIVEDDGETRSGGSWREFDNRNRR